ncbi:MAG: hypothetical protein AB8I08_32415 [Sandaracinaceae bacterium]
MESVERAFRLLPTERVLWVGAPRRASPEGAWRWGPPLLAAMGVIALLFAALLGTAELPGGPQVAMVGVLALLTAGAVRLAPGFILDTCEFAVTDRRILWKRGEIRRSMDRHGLTYARIRWHPQTPTIGTLELVRAVPFGPLARKQRIVFHHLSAPDEVLAVIRQAGDSSHRGDHTTPLLSRLDPDEEPVWVAAPEGPGIGWRDVGTSALGLAVLFVGLPIGLRGAVVLAELEGLGLSTRSSTWLLLFSAVALTAVVILAVGLGLAWYGILRARAMGHDTQYVLTDRRILIRRGRTELSLDRGRVVDIAETRAWRGLSNLHLVLDGPDARALNDSGALGSVTPSRDAVVPVLYELRDVSGLRSALLGRISRPSIPGAA